MKLQAAIILLAFSLTAAGAQAKVLAKVNGVEITDEDFKVAMDDIGPGLPAQVQGPERDAYVLDYLIDLKIVARKAEADKMDGGADFLRRMAYQRDKALMEGLFGMIARDATTDAELRKVEAAAASGPICVMGPGGSLLAIADVVDGLFKYRRVMV